MDGCHPKGSGPNTELRIWLSPPTMSVNRGSTTPVIGLIVGRMIATGAPPFALGKYDTPNPFLIPVLPICKIG